MNHWCRTVKNIDGSGSDASIDRRQVFARTCGIFASPTFPSIDVSDNYPETILPRWRTPYQSLGVPGKRVLHCVKRSIGTPEPV